MENLKKYKVLVVDDERELREAIMFDFKRKGFTVLGAADGREAIDIVKSQQIHLVISDIRMPGVDGMSLLKEIREYDPDIPVVILVTGYSEVTEAEALAKGAKNIFQKPFDRKVFMKTAMESIGLQA